MKRNIYNYNQACRLWHFSNKKVDRKTYLLLCFIDWIASLLSVLSFYNTELISMCVCISWLTRRANDMLSRRKIQFEQCDWIYSNEFHKLWTLHVTTKCNNKMYDGSWWWRCDGGWIAHHYYYSNYMLLFINKWQFMSVCVCARARIRFGWMWETRIDKILINYRLSCTKHK